MGNGLHEALFADLGHEGLHVVAGAFGFDDFLVGVNFGGGEGVLFADEGAEGFDFVFLGLGEGLEVEVAEDDDADVVFVVVADVLSLVVEGAELPDAAGAVDGEVVADVLEAAAAVVLADVFQVLGGFGVVGGSEGFGVAGVVEGDELDAVHGVDGFEVGAFAGPGGAGEDAVGVGGFFGGRRSERFAGQGGCVAAVVEGGVGKVGVGEGGGGILAGGDGGGCGTGGEGGEEGAAGHGLLVGIFGLCHVGLAVAGSRPAGQDGHSHMGISARGALGLEGKVRRGNRASGAAWAEWVEWG